MLFRPTPQYFLDEGTDRRVLGGIEGIVLRLFDVGTLRYKLYHV